MKKLVKVLTAMALMGVLTLTGCGDTAEEKQDAATEEVVEEESEVDEAAFDDTFKIKVGETVFTAPFAIDTLIEAGYTVSYEEEFLEDGKLSPNGDRIFARFTNEAGDFLIADIVNNTDEPLALEEAVIEVLSFEPNSGDVSISTGIKCGMSVDEAVALIPYEVTDEKTEGLPNVWKECKNDDGYILKLTILDGLIARVAIVVDTEMEIE